MKKTDLFIIAFSSIVSNKTRTALSMLGVIIGVITIILVVAIGTGAQKQVQDQFKSLNVNTIMVMGMRGIDITQKDIDLIGESPYISTVAGFYRSNVSVNSSDASVGTVSLSGLGITADLFKIISLKFDTGAMFDATVEKEKYVILGYGALTQLFPNQTAASVMNTTVTIAKKDYTIVGVLQKSGAGFGPVTFDDAVYFPTKTYEKYIVKQKPLLQVIALAKDTKYVAQAVEDMTQKLTELHELESGSNNLRVIDAGSSVSTAIENAKTLTYLLIGVASIVFIVSGIGIMNVMFASVAERTKEIGILKSIGANQSSVLWQFLLESFILTLLGSLLGVIVGEVVIFFDPFGDTLPLLRSVYGDIMAVIFAMMTGIFFGWYPAWRASKLDPVDALRL
ncbi:MAG: ABC transporter permease [Candidatus Gracilibacteria bacterium]